MKLKSMMKKIKTSNQVAEITGNPYISKVYIYVDDCAVIRLNGKSWFDSWQDLVDVLRRDYSHEVLETLAYGELTRVEANRYTVKNELDIAIDITFCFGDKW